MLDWLLDDADNLLLCVCVSMCVFVCVYVCVYVCV